LQMDLRFLQEDVILYLHDEGNRMSERVTQVDYNWKDHSPSFGDVDATVVILNDSLKYEEMSNDESYDQRVFFYFQDEAEFQRAFNPDSDEFEFVILREDK
jgi:hypothetical protein